MIMKNFVCGKYTLGLQSKNILMGILNVTPDSFSDTGKYFDTSKAVDRAFEMKEEGADIIDIGGESTRPDSEPVSLQDELNRVIPVIEKLEGNLDMPISVDTMKPEVADAALKVGASIINDVSGLRDENMAEIVSNAKAAVVIMHMRGTPKIMQKNIEYNNLLNDIKTFLADRVKFALTIGISPESIAIDPGIGFGKQVEHNLEIIRNINSFSDLGLPILIGPSRKSFIGAVLNLQVNERLFGTAGAVAASVIYGADIIRVHDVKAMRQVIDMARAIKTGIFNN